MPSGHGAGSRATQFKRNLEQRPISVYKRGPHRGEPRICKLCPEFVRVSSRRYNLCPTHIRQFNHTNTKTHEAKRRLAHAADVLGITRPPSKPLSQYPIRAQHRGYKGLFGHIPDNYQDIAHRELNMMLTKRPNPNKHQYAAMVAAATAMAKYGGRYEWAKAMRVKRLQIARWRKFLSQPQPNI